MADLNTKQINFTAAQVEKAINFALTQVAVPFSTEATYAVDDYVTYDGFLYQCITAITEAGAWDASKWQIQKIFDNNGYVIIQGGSAPESPNYLCFTAKTDNTKVVVGVYSTTENVGSTISVDYSTDGSTWNTVTTGYEHFSDTTEARGFCIANLNTGDKIYFKNKVVYRPSDTTGKPSSTHYEFIKCFGAYPIIRVGENVQFWDGQSAGYTTDADVSGDISSLLNFKTVLEPTSQEKIEAGYSIWSGNGEGCGDEYAFYGLFNGWPALTSAANLILPYSTLLDYDYAYMFKDCTSLTVLPTLPATTLAKSCYSSMFSGCTSLVNAPSLPATTLAQSCYGNMFYNCTALTVVPTLPATTLAQTCYSSMFRGCTALQVNDSLVSGVAEQAWTIPSTGTFTNTYSQSAMFTNCAGTRASNNMAGAAGNSYTYYTQNTPV